MCLKQILVSKYSENSIAIIVGGHEIERRIQENDRCRGYGLNSICLAIPEIE
jgi:hypothetical protein